MEYISRIVPPKPNFQGFVEAVCDIGIGPEYRLRTQGKVKFVVERRCTPRLPGIVAIHIFAMLILAPIALILLAFRQCMRADILSPEEFHEKRQAAEVLRAKRKAKAKKDRKSTGKKIAPPAVEQKTIEVQDRVSSPPKHYGGKQFPQASPMLIV